MRVFNDQMNRSIELPHTPTRIISLVPSQTELLFDLGIKEELVGITKFCIHPEGFYKNKTFVGGTKKINFDKIFFLQPDLIIGNKEENEQHQMETLMQEYPVWMSNIKNLDDALDMIIKVGELVGKGKKALEISDRINLQFKELETIINRTTPQKKVAYFIWKNPYMSINEDTFIHHLLSKLNLKNVFQNNTSSRYPIVSADDIASENPDYIFLSSEPYPFKEKHLKEFAAICPETKVILVDGELFSWYGSRLLKVPTYFRELLSILHGDSLFLRA